MSNEYKENVQRKDREHRGNNLTHLTTTIYSITLLDFPTKNNNCSATSYLKGSVNLLLHVIPPGLSILKAVA